MEHLFDISEKEYEVYYDRLKRLFSLRIKPFIPEHTNLLRQQINKPLHIKRLLDVIWEKYGYDFYKYYQDNYIKFQLWQTCFDCRRDDYLNASVLYVLFCCFSDRILDDSSIPEYKKNDVIRMLNINTFMSKINHRSAASCPELNVLAGDIVKLLFGNKKSEKIPEGLESHIKRAFYSEIKMQELQLDTYLPSEHSLNDLTDKSIEFELGAFLICSLGNPLKESEEAATAIANLFWLIDDLCDIKEDIMNNRCNSLLFLFQPESREATIRDRFHRLLENQAVIVGMIETNLLALKRLASNSLYTAIAEELNDWIKCI